jgi:pyruvate dehydrogenase E2 component (dihydrolipoamide acetyltransferase)
MPRQGQSVESCIISNWAKKVGDKVAEGDILFTYETDKATFDEEAKVSGTLLATFFSEGDDVPCLTNVCVIGDPGESFAEFDPKGGSAPAAPKAEAAPEAPKTEPAAPAAAPAPAAKPAGPKSDANPVIMPRQGQSVESCIISKWNVKVGDTVKVGDALFTYETDKATFDEESKFEGTVLAIFAKEGDDVPCLQNVAVIGKPGDSFAEFDPSGAAASAPAAAEAAPAPQQAAEAVAPAPVRNAEGRHFVSPRARNFAARTGVNTDFVVGTGAEGRVMERDVREFIANGGNTTFAAADAAKAGMQGTAFAGKIGVGDLTAKPAEAVKAEAPKAEPAKTAEPAKAEAPKAADYEDVKIPNIRKVISRSMHASLSTMAQLTLNASFDATNILEFRRQLKEVKDKLGLANVTINDIILYAVSRTILNYKDCNANFIEDGTVMRYFKNVHLGIAVDTPRGLMVPTLRDANLKSLNQISVEAKALATAAQSGTINPDDLKGGTFTVTNLGTMGIESFTPVINPPQTCILGVNTLQTRVKSEGGVLKSYQAMTLSLTFDHRALDGAPAAKFLQELCKNLENFTMLLIK